MDNIEMLNLHIPK